MEKRAAVALIVVVPLVTAGHQQHTHANGGMKNLGMISLKSVHGYYSQAHTDGELHGSNSGRNEEETWSLFEVNAADHVYALQNWRNGKYLSLQADRFCARASSIVVS